MPSRVRKCQVTACSGLLPLSRDTAKMLNWSQLSACMGLAGQRMVH